ncbi:MAG TPA: PilZ domain-containing protein [Terriglobales bacterium]
MSRNAKRHRVYLDVELFDSRRGRCVAKANDVSENGMSVYAPVKLLPAELLKLLFQLPGDVFLAMEGVVKNGSSGRYGIRFIGVTDVQRRRLRQYLADLAASGAAE